MRGKEFLFGEPLMAKSPDPGPATGLLAQPKWFATAPQLRAHGRLGAAAPVGELSAAIQGRDIPKAAHSQACQTKIIMTVCSIRERAWELGYQCVGAPCPF